MTANTFSEHVVSITTSDNAAELRLFNNAYEIVAVGIGQIRVMLPEGKYRLQERAGSAERIHPIDVSNEAPTVIQLDKLLFPSPIPSTANSLASDYEAIEELLTKTGNFRLLIWMPIPPIPFSEAARITKQTRIEEELSKFSLRNFHTGEIYSLHNTVKISPQTFSAPITLSHLNLPVGPYVLVQRQDELRQRCMPVWICSDFSTSVYLVVPNLEGERIPASLDHASVTVTREKTPLTSDFASLLQSEVARKSLSRVPQDSDKIWSTRKTDSLSDPDHPMTALMVAHLSASADPEHIYNATEAFGENFPDILALRSSHSSLSAEHVWALDNLSAPPMLNRSWKILLSSPEGNKALSRIMKHAFQLTGTGPWLIWSEDVSPLSSVYPSWSFRTSNGVLREEIHFLYDALSFSVFFSNKSSSIRSISEDLYKLRPYIEELDLKDLSAIADRLRSTFYAHSNGLVALSMNEENALKEAIERLDFRMKVFDRMQPQALIGLTSSAEQILLSFISRNSVRQMFVALAKNDLLQKWLGAVDEIVRSIRPSIEQDIVHDFLASLQIINDPILRKAIGENSLIHQAFSSLNLPEENVERMARALLRSLIDESTQEDKKVAENAFRKEFS